MRGHLFRFLLVLLILFANGCSSRKGQTILIKGSDTEVNLVLDLAEVYMAKDPAISVAITGGGSGLGIAALLNGKTQVCNSSRPLSQDEINLARERGIDLRTTVFAMDAVAIIVNKAVGLNTISLEELATIYSGNLSNWQSVGGRIGLISLYGRQTSSGTYIYLRDKVIQRDYSPKIRELNGTAQVIEAVSQDPHGIGYVGVGYISDIPKQGIYT
ncbi:phosphate ABC transporter substrate-binding protein [Spirosoma aureum]|uniref:Phosphate ABC transporter substrate-binding protein n=1 Tax=Spirosoma aureum TaxID=2692134 RepID=A0A6G9AN45_9BACT|nr:substrate-binding domain-containing protein [Spirosoma aureum]QIP13744.1 phosphate ABC transporter substrate-binding protein [Spirosoma aureum]